MPMPSLHEAARKAGGDSGESDGYIIAENLNRYAITELKPRGPRISVKVGLFPSVGNSQAAVYEGGTSRSRRCKLKSEKSLRATKSEAAHICDMT